MNFSLIIPPRIKFPALRITSDRLLLRPPAMIDCADWIALREKNRDHLVPFEPQWHPKSLTPRFFKLRLASQSRGWALGQSCSFLIFRRSDDVLIGGINLNNICRGAAQYASPGYWLGEEFQGVGYMHEAMDRLITYAFDGQKLHRLNAASLPHNGRSIKLLRKLGFEEEGFAKAYLQINGEWQDHILYGLDAEHFRKRSGIVV